MCSPANRIVYSVELCSGALINVRRELTTRDCIASLCVVAGVFEAAKHAELLVA